MRNKRPCKSLGSGIGVLFVESHGAALVDRYQQSVSVSLTAIGLASAFFSTARIGSFFMAHASFPMYSPFTTVVSGNVCVVV